MGLLDIFHSKEHVRKRHAEELVADIDRARGIFLEYLDNFAEKRTIINDYAHELHAQMQETRKSPKGETPAELKQISKRDLARLQEMFPKELHEFVAEEDLTREEKALLERLERKEGKSHALVDIGKELSAMGHQMEAVHLQMKALATIVKAELDVLRHLPHHEAAIFELSRLVEHESAIGITLMHHIENDYGPFDRLLHSAKDNLLAASVEEKIKKAEDRLQKRYDAWEARRQATDPAYLPDDHPINICRGVFEGLLLDAGAPFTDMDEGMEKMERIEAIMDNDKELLKAIKKHAPKMSEQARLELMTLFKKMRDELGFEDIDKYT